MFDNHIKEVVKNMAEVYRKRHEVKKLSPNVWRGTSTNCASEFENLMGKFIGEAFGDDFMVLVSYTLTLRRPEIDFTPKKKPNKNGISYRKHDTKEPDVLVYRKSDNNIIAILDLKNDVGRTNDEWVKEANTTREMLKKAVKITYKTKEDKKNYVELKYEDDPHYSFVILNAENEHNKLAKYFKKMDENNLTYFVLNTETHLNDIDNVTEAKINCEENVYQWECLSLELEKLTQQFKK